MKGLGFESPDQLFEAIEMSPEIRRECGLIITVPISRFFRDRVIWENLQYNILPEIINGNGNEIKAWSAGCASGEEVYSLKIAWDSLNLDDSKITIKATDINPAYLKRAKDGRYSSSSLKEVPGEFLDKYFIPLEGDDLFEVSSELKSGIEWEEGDLISDPTAFNFHLVFMRNNMLTYYENHQKDEALIQILKTLVPGGYLIIGAHETLPRETKGKLTPTSFPMIFKRNG